MPSSSYSLLLQAKAIILAIIVFAGFYILDNFGKRAPLYQHVEDYLQFVTPFYACTLAFLYDDIRPSLKQFITALASVSLVTYVLKYLVDAKRPNGVGGYSFPSGHTSFAFSAAAMVHKRYHLYYAIPAYANAVLIGYLRIFHHKHYLIDVICGTIIGVAITWKIVSRKS